VRVSLTSLRGGPAVGRGPRDRGFTLIELLVVAAILGLAAAIAAPRIGALGPRVDLGTSARQVIDVVRLAQVTSANSGRAVYVDYDLTAGALRVVGSEPFPGEGPPAEYLPEGVSIYAVRPEGGPEVTNGSVRVVVFPGGYPWPHEVELRTSTGSRLTVHVRGLETSIGEGSQ